MPQETYSIDKLIGLTMREKNPTDYYNVPTYMPNPIKLGTVKTGDIIGVVNSWTGGTADKPLHLEFKRLNGTTYYVPMKRGQLDHDFNKAQGLTTTQEDKAAAEDKDKSFFDQLLDTLKKSGKYVLIGGAALIALNIILKNRK